MRGAGARTTSQAARTSQEAVPGPERKGPFNSASAAILAHAILQGGTDWQQSEKKEVPRAVQRQQLRTVLLGRVQSAWRAAEA